MIENFLGFPTGISGAELAERARQQAVRFGAELLMMREGVKATFRDNRIVVDMADGETMVAKANICATGVEYRRLNLPREDEFLGAGFYYGAGASEAPLCRAQEVVVVGGGNSAGQAVMHLADYAAKVTMLVRDDTLAASLSDYLAERILAHPRVEVRFESELVGLDGTEGIERVRVWRANDQGDEQIETSRVFVCIGGQPNTEWARDTAIIRDSRGYLVTGPDLLTAGKPPRDWPLPRPPYFLETSVPGSFAVGDVRHGSVKRVASAVGEGAMAVSFIHRYLQETH